MRKLLTIIMLMSLASNAQAFDEWTTEEKTAQVVYTFLHGFDWMQTGYIAAHPDEYNEINAVLGKNPTQNEVNIYMGLTLVGHYAISAVLPHKWRKRWQYMTLSMEFGAVSNNISLGVKF